MTPSSPSPDPNHPDYPEFFEDRLYLEHLAKGASPSQVLKTRSQEDDRPTSSRSRSEDSFTLVLEESVSDCDVEMEEQDTPEIEELLQSAEDSNLAEAGSVPGQVLKVLRQEQERGRHLGGRIHTLE